ncbi:membrane protein [Gordonia phage Madeline]|uniref:Membrane protein n=1 Tax=Gordonia phage Madeline TaxID=2591189 RepID=A0A514A2V4_9CAUD|nr:membrane protein [Gordonia phage Madeline]QDH47620.1 membrane protein [Gordonia phage Madeline]
MQDIQLDTNGDFRCANCGGKNFSEKRTRRAKVIGVTAGVATVGLAGAAAPLVAKKRLYCQACGVYNRMGDAQPYAPKARQAATKPKSSAEESSPLQVFVGMLVLAVAAAIGLVSAISAGSILWSVLAGLATAVLGLMAFATGQEALSQGSKSTPPRRSSARAARPPQASRPKPRDPAGSYLEIKKPLKRPGLQNQSEDSSTQ